MVKRYVKKPVVIRAIQWNGGNHREIAHHFTGATFHTGLTEAGSDEYWLDVITHKIGQ